LADYNITASSYRGVIEVSGTDTMATAFLTRSTRFHTTRSFGRPARGGRTAFSITADDRSPEQHNVQRGLSSELFSHDGPLQPGNYRLTVTSSDARPFRQHLAAPYCVSSLLAILPGYVLRPHQTPLALATALALTKTRRE